MFRSLATATLLLSATGTAHAQQAPFEFHDAQLLLKKYCAGCHQGKSAAAGFNLAPALAAATFPADSQMWAKLIPRVRNSEMPPKGLPAPNLDERQQLVGWIDAQLKTAACAGGIVAGPYPTRRLNRDEYAATIRDLLNIHSNAAHALPADGAGGEGFDNAAETLFLSPIHAEKYLEAAKESLSNAAKDPKSREIFLIAEPGAGVTPDQAATKILGAFLPRAFRRPVAPEETRRYLALFHNAQKRGESFDHSILFALDAVLISPNFLFRMEEPNPSPEARPVADYALASRLSYFLWGTMPDAKLNKLAAQGTLSDPVILTAQVTRMLADVKSRDFAERFVEQWLGTRELGRDIKPDQKLFPLYYDAEVQGAIRYEPVLFFQEILAKDLSLLNLIDSRFTFLTNKLSKLYGFTLKETNQQPKRFELPANSHRGGMLTMSAVLAVSSYPQRTSPVLRGKWILENILGTPPPPPPANVPALPENHPGAASLTLRERLEQHRADPTCASCHSRIDPLGFALENYDVLGRWRTEDSGKPIDSKGQLPDGTEIAGPDDLKKVLLERKDPILRNFTSKMLGYALGRGLTVNDSCAVDAIMRTLTKEDYSAQTLIREIVLSIPFRYQAGKMKETR